MKPGDLIRLKRNLLGPGYACEAGDLCFVLKHEGKSQDDHELLEVLWEGMSIQIVSGVCEVINETG